MKIGWPLRDLAFVGERAVSAGSGKEGSENVCRVGTRSWLEKSRFGNANHCSRFRSVDLAASSGGRSSPDRSGRFFRLLKVGKAWQVVFDRTGSVYAFEFAGWKHS